MLSKTVWSVALLFVLPASAQVETFDTTRDLAAVRSGADGMFVPKPVDSAIEDLDDAAGSDPSSASTIIGYVRVPASSGDLRLVDFSSFVNDASGTIVTGGLASPFALAPSAAGPAFEVEFLNGIQVSFVACNNYFNAADFPCTNIIERLRITAFNAAGAAVATVESSDNIILVRGIGIVKLRIEDVGVNPGFPMLHDFTYIVGAGCAADLAGDGVVNTSDANAFVTAFNAGCP